MTNKDYLIKALASYLNILSEAAHTSEQYEDEYMPKVRRVDNLYTTVLLILKSNSSSELEDNYNIDTLMDQFPIVY